jgi:hypothetical protein
MQNKSLQIGCCNYSKPLMSLNLVANFHDEIPPLKYKQMVIELKEMFIPFLDKYFAQIDFHEYESKNNLLIIDEYEYDNLIEISETI